jgi:hypothetical protein
MAKIQNIHLNLNGKCAKDQASVEVHTEADLIHACKCAQDMIVVYWFQRKWIQPCPIVFEINNQGDIGVVNKTGLL